MNPFSHDFLHFEVQKRVGYCNYSIQCSVNYVALLDLKNCQHKSLQNFSLISVFERFQLSQRVFTWTNNFTITLTLRFPMRQIGALLSLKSDCTKRALRLIFFFAFEKVEYRWQCQKVGRPFFYHKQKLEHLSNHTYSHNSKNQRPEFHKSHDFLTFRADCARLRGHRIL